MLSELQISIKEKKRELRAATKTIKLRRTRKPNYESHFIKHAKTLYNEVPELIQETEKYCAVVPKLKRYLFEKTWVTLMYNQAFDFINCVCFPAQSPGEELPFLCTWCDVKFSVFWRFPMLNFGFLCIRIRIQPIFIITKSALSPYSFVFDNFVSVHIVYVFIYLFTYSIIILIQQFRITLSVSFYIRYSSLQSTYSINLFSTDSAHFLDP